MNKFDLLNIVTVSNLKDKPKILLMELLLRSNASWQCYPGTKRLAQACGIKNTRHFPGVEAMLPGLVSHTGWQQHSEHGWTKKYTLDVEAIAALPYPDMTGEPNDEEEGGYPTTTGEPNEDEQGGYPVSTDRLPRNHGEATPYSRKGYPVITGSYTSNDSSNDSSKNADSADATSETSNPSKLEATPESRGTPHSSKSGDFSDSEGQGPAPEKPTGSPLPRNDGVASFQEKALQEKKDEIDASNNMSKREKHRSFDENEREGRRAATRAMVAEYNAKKAAQAEMAGV